MPILSDLLVPLTQLINISFQSTLLYYSNKDGVYLETDSILQGNLLFLYQIDNHLQPYYVLYLDDCKVKNLDIGYSNKYYFEITSRVGVRYKFSTPSKVKNCFIIRKKEWTG